MMIIPRQPLSKEDALIVQKEREALAFWAANKITREQKEYAYKLYSMFAVIVMAYTGCDKLTAIRETPYFIPTKTASKKKWPFPPSIIDEYETVLGKAKKWKNTKFRNEDNQIMTAQEIFPGVPKNKVLNYRTMIPSQIAYDYLAWKYKLPMSGEAVKKHLGYMRLKLNLAKSFNPRLVSIVREREEKGYPADMGTVVAALYQCIKPLSDPYKAYVSELFRQKKVKHSDERKNSILRQMMKGTS